MKEYRHKVFNPKTDSLESVVTTEPIENNWRLEKIVYVNEWNAVAVFEVVN